MLKLLAMPFRGLYYIFIGFLMSLPLWALGAVLGLDTLAPFIGETVISQMTDYQTDIGKCTIHLKNNFFRFNDIRITNPKPCETADFLNIREVAVQLESLSPLKTWHAKQCEIDIGKLVIVYSKGQNTLNNHQNMSMNAPDGSNLDIFLQKILQKLGNTLNKPMKIDILVLKFNGLLSIYDYRNGTGIPRRTEHFVLDKVTFRNVNDPIRTLHNWLVSIARGR